MPFTYPPFSALLFQPLPLLSEALMMAGWALRDALEDYPGRWMEVHISNLFGREAFRHASVTAPLCHGFIAGMGTDAYAAAAALLIEKYHG